MAMIQTNDEKIHRVMPLLLRLEKNQNDYFPEIVSLGPYHHGKPELALVEAFKPNAVDLFISDAAGNKEFYYNKVLDMIGDIRSCYEEEYCNYSDDYLARMMLQDASLIIIYMEVCTLEQTRQGDDDSKILDKFWAMKDHLSVLALAMFPRDLTLLENQIPLGVVKLLLDLRYGDGRYHDLLTRYMNLTVVFGEYRQKRVVANSEALHLLEAIHHLLVWKCVKTEKASQRRCCFKFKIKKETGADPEKGAPPPPPPPPKGKKHGWIRRLLNNKEEAGEQNINIKKYIHSFNSVTNLKAKGIYFKPSPTRSLMDINFKSYFFYARLQLPEWGVSTMTKVLLMNLVAYELRPNSRNNCEVASYMSFMKSIIDTAEDVKELRERKILYNMLGGDEEILNVYRDINPHGAINPSLFGRLKHDIEEHCNNRIKTWMAELVHNYFQSPWTIISLLAAVALLAISVAQLYYAVHPNS